jgi:tetratricopeptide (TPR) repeat protein
MHLRNVTALIPSLLFAFNLPVLASHNRWDKEMLAENTAYQQCRLDEAGKYLKAAAKQAMHFSLDDPRLVKTLNAGGDLFRAEGQFRRAELAYYQALIWGGASLKPDDPALARSLVGLGIVSQETHQRDYERAESFLNEGLAIQNKALGADSLEVAFTLNCLGELNMLRLKDGVAESFFRRALAIRRKELSPDDPAMAQTLEDLALVYIHQGRLERAAALFQEVLSIYKKSLGPDHCELALALRNYADLLTKMGRVAEASQLEAEALAIAQRHLPKNMTSIPFYSPALLGRRH